VLIPAHVKKLDETNIALGEATGHETVVSVTSTLADFGSVHLEDVPGLVRNIGELGDGHLHAVGELVGTDTSIDFGISCLGSMPVVDLVQMIHPFAASCLIEPFWVLEVEDGVACAHKFDTGVLGGEETATPEAVVEGLAVRPAGAAGNHSDESWEVGVLRAETIGEPRSNTRAPRELVPGLEEGDGRVVVDVLGLHRLDVADRVGNPGDVGEEFADGSAALAMACELVAGSGNREGTLPGSHAGDAFGHLDVLGELFTTKLVQSRLMVEEILLGGRTALEKVNNALGFGRIIREPGGGACGEVLLPEERGKGCGPNTGGRPPEKMATSH